jgi:hypothetical protein
MAEHNSEEKKESILAPWHKPTPANLSFQTGLKMMNSLTRQPEEFITMSGDNQVTWYMYVLYIHSKRWISLS